jgi:hypothetical protein
MFVIREVGDWIGLAASIVCIAAGIYLLSLGVGEHRVQLV